MCFICFCMKHFYWQRGNERGRVCVPVRICVCVCVCAVNGWKVFPWWIANLYWIFWHYLTCMRYEKVFWVCEMMHICLSCLQLQMYSLLCYSGLIVVCNHIQSLSLLGWGKEGGGCARSRVLTFTCKLVWWDWTCFQGINRTFSLLHTWQAVMWVVCLCLVFFFFKDFMTVAWLVQELGGWGNQWLRRRPLSLILQLEVTNWSEELWSVRSFMCVNSDN